MNDSIEVQSSHEWPVTADVIFRAFIRKETERKNASSSSASSLSQYIEQRDTIICRSNLEWKKDTPLLNFPALNTVKATVACFLDPRGS